MDETNGTEEVHRFAVTYKPRRGDLTVWLVIDGAPAEVGTDEVEEALTGWRRWPEWNRRVAPGGVVNVRHVTGQLARRLGDGATSAEFPNAIRLRWSELVPERRTLTVPLPGDLYGLLSRQARAEGVSLREWAESLLREAAGSRCAR